MSVEDLRQQKTELEARIQQIDSAAEKILILQAIKNQRWYFFENNDEIIFDRDTALLWTPALTDIDAADNPEQYLEHLLRDTNSKKHGGYSDWKIPSVSELNKIVNSGIPYKYDKWTCKYDSGYGYAWANLYFWLDRKSVDTNSFSSSYSSDDLPKVVPVSYALVPQNYSATPQEVLDIFRKNQLIPKFELAEITQIYRQLYVENERLALEKQIAAIDVQIVELQSRKPKIIAPIDYKPLLKKYDVESIDESPIQYCTAVKSLAEYLLETLQDCEAARGDTLSEFSQISLKLGAKFMESPHLTAEENAMLRERQQILARRLELGTTDTKLQILSVKAQAEELSARIDKINRSENSIAELAKLKAEPRVSFEFLTENLAHIVNDAQGRINFFVTNKNFVAAVANALAAWSEDYKSFKTKLREDLQAVCSSGGIDAKICSAWYDDWTKTRFAIEQRFLPLVNFALDGNLLTSDAALKALEILQAYKAAVDNFYLNERKNIHQKFAFTAGGELQEKFETESELYKFTEKFQRDLQAIIFAREKTEERIFLLRWSEPLTNMPLDEIINFVHDRSLDAISAEILNQFSELSRQNFAVYISDAQIYSQALKQRDDDFNALIYKMRMDLQQK